jgi:serine beta-lactamase-like protein LACTB
MAIVALSCVTPGRSPAEPLVAPPSQYAEAVRALEPFIARQVADKGLPALSIALVDDQTVVWAKGFGYAKPDGKVPATADTVYRVGSVSKLFTDIAVMQLVEQGKLNLDAPITDYLPDFKPRNPFDKPITLRHLMAHRSGLVREPPVGNYFDPTDPPLARTVSSLNQTELVYEPGSRIKYSNAAIATVGYVLEKTQRQPFTEYVHRRVLEPLGLRKSAFEPKPALTKDLAVATMWTYHGRQFTAPTFELGMAPAGSMYSTVNDLAHFLSVLFAGGKGADGPILKPATLAQMFAPQFAKAEEKTGFGIGFHITEFEGRRRIGHGGAIYGFATELAALPGDKLGVVVVASKDGANAVTTRIADVALGHMLAARQGKPLPKIEETTPLKPDVARRLAGRYRSRDKKVDLTERAGKLHLLPARGGLRMELRAVGDALMTDDVVFFGQKIVPEGDKLHIGKDVYERIAVTKPPPAPARWLGLIGEYGWDHNTIYILEKEGKLYALIEWFYLYPLEEMSENVFRFPDFGLYHGEKLVFGREKAGRASQVEAASVVFKRRPGAADDETFRIRPLHPIGELRPEALAAKPPAEKGEFRRPDLVELTTLDDTIKLDIRYATDNNFLGTPLYTSAHAYLQRPAAQALVRIHRQLAEQGYGLLVYDAYRPWHVTKMFWEATPEKDRIFVADPSKGSRHNRGCAVDLTLYERKTGKVVPMVSGYDEFSDRAYPGYLGGTSLQRWHRDLLRRAMEEAFTVFEAEWWHFDFKEWTKYPIGNLTFEDIAAGRAD